MELSKREFIQKYVLTRARAISENGSIYSTYDIISEAERLYDHIEDTLTEK
jgi:hypothetical protein